MVVKKDLRLSSILIRWYNDNKRDLPWRNTTDPYKIWISEVILQQTRVDQGLSYFNRFVARFPSVKELAEASEEEVLKLWQGLGYYSRARNLHATANMIMNKFDGIFPVEYKNILSLRGIGEYTAAAIASFSYNQPYAVVDGNVYRVLSRIFAIDIPINSGRGKKEFLELANILLDGNEAGLHNQAIMEFGALQCVPVSPDCSICPASPMCIAYGKDAVAKYPVKTKLQKNRARYFSYFDIRCGEYMYLHKRTDKDIWQNLYELPLIETDEESSIENLNSTQVLGDLLGDSNNAHIRYVKELRHILSHQTIYARFYQVKVDHIILNDKYLKIRIEDIDLYPVSRLVHKYLEVL